MSETLTRAVRIDPATRYVRSLPGNFIMLREAAMACGTSEYVLRKFISDDTPGLQPSKYTMFGKVKIYLYTDEDVRRIQDHLKSRKVVFEHDGQARRLGRPPKYTTDERKWRDKMHTRKWYWNNRAKVLADKGDEAGAQKALKKVADIDKELKKK